MAWILLLFAGVLEVVWAYFMKQSHGFTRVVPSIIAIATMIASFVLLSASVKTLPLGTAYTIWTGIGALGAFLVGIVALNEPVTSTRIIAVAFIIIGVALVKLSS